MTPDEYTGLLNNFETVTYPTKTYFLDAENKRITGYVSGLKAMEQAIYKILMTERFEYIIYSWNYGVEFKTIMGNLYPYIYSVIKERIIEALMQDDRITNVYNFDFVRNKVKRCLLVTFDVDTTQGNLTIKKEVNLYV